MTLHCYVIVMPRRTQMAKPNKNVKPAVEVLQKCPTGIKGLDEITGGGLPKGRPTLVCGGTGCGKTPGIGIADDKKGILFQAFSQVDESHSRSYGCAGLGLVISKEIVE